jgi:UDP-2,3-diacylglucosamine pyrophosphatase LpxH
MKAFKRLDKVYEASEKLEFNDTSRIILMSDCHRGDGSWADDFFKNQNIYYSALNYYYKEDFTYIELGDGDELWKNKDMYDIVGVHRNVFELLSRFFNEGRLHFIYGNHDIVKKHVNFAKEQFSYYYSERLKKRVKLFDKLKFHEGIVLYHEANNYELLLLHGHQVDFMNSTLWRFSRFLVRYFWRPLETFGVNDPTSTAKNYERKEVVDERLTEWAKARHILVVAGHTHRPMFPNIGEELYFNDGCCVHPRCITGIEIFEGGIRLVKWSTKTREDGTLYIGRDLLGGPYKLKLYF